MNAYNGIADTNELSYLGGFRSNSIYYKNEAVTHEGKLYFSVKDENVSVPCEGNWTWPELTIVEGATNAPKTASITLVPSNENSMTPAETMYGALAITSMVLNVGIFIFLVAFVMRDIETIKKYILSRKKKKKHNEFFIR